MKASKNKDGPRTRHPTLWTVEAVRWEYRDHQSEYERLLAKKGEKGPGVQLGEGITRAEVADRPFAIAVAHHLLDRHAEEAAGRMSLEIHIHPPEQDLGDENVYTVSAKVIEQARALGIEGDVAHQVKVMARDGTPNKEHLRHGRYAIRVEGNSVTSITLIDPPKRPGKAS
jgi:hypothetical protein